MVRSQIVFILGCVLSPASWTLAGSETFDFSSPSEVGVFGSAEWRSSGGSTGGFVSLTDATFDQRGAVIFPDIDQGAPVSEFSLNARVRIGGGTELPADGISFNFVRPDDPLLTTGGLSGWSSSPLGEVNLPEEGSTTGLSVAFDEWYSGGEDVIGMSIRIDNQLVAEVPVDGFHNSPAWDSLQTGPSDLGPQQLTELPWEPLRISMTPDHRLTVDYKGYRFFDQVVNFTDSPGQWVFGARTGGSTSYHHIDDTRLTSSTPTHLGLVRPNTALSINTLGSASDIDTELALFSESGQLLATNDDIGFSDFLSEIQLSQYESGRYHIAVGGYDSRFENGPRALAGTSSGDYRLSIGSTAVDRFLASNEVDWYSVDLRQPIAAPPQLNLDAWRANLSPDVIVESVHHLGGSRPVLDIIEAKRNPQNGHVYYLVRGISPDRDDRQIEPGFCNYFGYAADDLLSLRADNLGGYSVAINDQAEMDWIVENFKGDATTGQDFLIMLQMGTEWQSGESVEFNNWLQGEQEFHQGLALLHNYPEANYQWTAGWDWDGERLSIW